MASDLICFNYQVLKTFQIKVEINGTEVHTIVPHGHATVMGLDNDETKEFCTAASGKHSLFHPRFYFFIEIFQLLSSKCITASIVYRI